MGMGFPSEWPPAKSPEDQLGLGVRLQPRPLEDPAVWRGKPRGKEVASGGCPGEEGSVLS